MNPTLLQIVATIWIGAHPVTVTVPRLYTGMESTECYTQAARLEAKLLWLRKDRKIKVSVGCEQTNGRHA